MLETAISPCLTSAIYESYHVLQKDRPVSVISCLPLFLRHFAPVDVCIGLKSVFASGRAYVDIETKLSVSDIFLGRT